MGCQVRIETGVALEDNSVILRQAKESGTMDLDKVLAELLKERKLIDEAISHLERLSVATQGISSRPLRREHPEKPHERARGVRTTS
jgi:hypothetical protein